MRVSRQRLKLVRETPGGEAVPVAGTGALGVDGARGVGMTPGGSDLGMVEAGHRSATGGPGMSGVGRLAGTTRTVLLKSPSDVGPELLTVPV